MNSMATLLLDFQHPRRRQGMTGLIILFCGLVGTIILASHLFITLRNLDAVETRYSITKRQSSNTQHVETFSAAEKQKLSAEIHDANSVMLQLSLPWNDLFKGLAASQQNQVALLAIAPDAIRRSIKISGEAKDLNVLLNYLRHLQKVKSLSSVYLEKHQFDTRSAQRPVRFTIIANWVLAQ